MEERRPTPLPPGVMPSSSNENLYAQLQADSDAQKREEKLLKPVRGPHAEGATCRLLEVCLCVRGATQKLQRPAAS